MSAIGADRYFQGFQAPKHKYNVFITSNLLPYQICVEMTNTLPFSQYFPNDWHIFSILKKNMYRKYYPLYISYKI